MGSKKLRTAIVGYGKMGCIRHKAMERHGGYDLICAAETSPVEGVESPVYKDYRDIFQHELDAVFCCAPNRFIPDIVCDALERGIHVFSEKPPGRNTNDVKRMQEAETAAANAVLKFGFNHRYHEAIEEAKAILDSGAFGKLYFMRGVYGKAGGTNYNQSWRNNPAYSGGGILIDQGIHMLDLFLHFAGGFDEVKSFVQRQFWTEVPVEDNAFALLRNSEGVVATLHSSATQWRHVFKLELYLEKGFLSVDGILSASGTYGTEVLTVAVTRRDADGLPTPNPELQQTSFTSDLSWDKEVAEFHRAIVDNAPVAHGSSKDAQAVMSLVERIYEADPNWADMLAKSRVV